MSFFIPISIFLVAVVCLVKRNGGEGAVPPWFGCHNRRGMVFLVIYATMAVWLSIVNNNLS